MSVHILQRALRVQPAILQSNTIIIYQYTHDWRKSKRVSAFDTSRAPNGFMDNPRVKVKQCPLYHMACTMSIYVNFLVKDQYFRRVVAAGAYTSKEGECGFSNQSNLQW